MDKEKEYGIEYEKEVLAAFDRMKNDYDKAGPVNTIVMDPVSDDDVKKVERHKTEKVVHTATRKKAPTMAFFGTAEEAVKNNKPVRSEAPDVTVKKATLSGTPKKHKKRKKKKAKFALPSFDFLKNIGKKKHKKSEYPEYPEYPEYNATAARVAVDEDVDDMDYGKKSKKSKKSKGHMPLWLKRVLILICMFVFFGIVFGGYEIYDIISKTPDINPNNIYDLLSENSVILDTDGNVVENIYKGSSLRTNVSYDDLPQDLIDCFVSIEDKTFWKHHGFNYIRIVGAIWEKVSGKKDRIGGTSTISQQLARNLYLVSTKAERSLERKIREAYYTIVIEHTLTKKQILEAYLNTIYLGYSCDGVQAASRAYFDKDVQDLNLIECACLASLPQNPAGYAPIKRVATNKVTDPDALDIVTKNDNWIVYYNDGGEQRLHLVFYYLHDQNKMDDATYEASKEWSIREYLNPGSNAGSSKSTTYFADYIANQVLSDLQTKLGYSKAEAQNMLYTGGLVIESTMDSRIQGIMDKYYSDSSNFPGVGTLNTDKNGNLLAEKVDPTVPDRIILYKKGNMFDSEGNFVLNSDEYEWMTGGDLCIYKGCRLNIYRVTSNGVKDNQIEFKPFYDVIDKLFYYSTGGYINIEPQFKSRDESNNVIISSEFIKDNPECFVDGGKGKLIISSAYFTVTSMVIEPQSAMVITDFSTGQIQGMVGGRNITGQKLYNRALSKRQPGSSIKPLSVYSTALEMGYREGGSITAASPLDDIPINYDGKLWPANVYNRYTGARNLRYAVEQSINTCAVNLFMQLDPETCVTNLQNMGISTLVTSGTINDINASALALGGMTNGTTPLEMTAAYGTFGNGGTYIEPTCYTTVKNRRGDVILTAKPIERDVYDPEVAQLMLDILETTVTKGGASAAKLKSCDAAGKTGTTSDRHDIWFCGLTPKYSGAVWVGNDINIPLNVGSSGASSIWKKVMDEVMEGEDAKYKKFPDLSSDKFVTCTVCKYSGKLATDLCSCDPSGASCALTEVFIKGTEPKEYCDAHVEVDVCTQTGYLATDGCYSSGCVEHVVRRVRAGGTSWEGLLNKYYLIDWDSQNAALLEVYNEKMQNGGFGDDIIATLENVDLDEDILLDKTELLDDVPDAIYDAPEYYCPLHGYYSVDESMMSELGMIKYGLIDNPYGVKVPEEEYVDWENPEGTEGTEGAGE